MPSNWSLVRYASEWPSIMSWVRGGRPLSISVLLQAELFLSSIMKCYRHGTWKDAGGSKD